MDNLSIAKNAQIIIFYNEWITNQDKATLETKAYIKKVANIKKKLLKKQDKA